MSKMMKSRWLARLKAWWLGYFWLPCPVCGENFAGFEKGSYCIQVDWWGTSKCVCDKPKCQEEAKAHRSVGNSNEA